MIYRFALASKILPPEAELKETLEDVINIEIFSNPPLILAFPIVEPRI